MLFDKYCNINESIHQSEGSGYAWCQVFSGGGYSWSHVSSRGGGVHAWYLVQGREGMGSPDLMSLPWEGVCMPGPRFLSTECACLIQPLEVTPIPLEGTLVFLSMEGTQLPEGTPAPQLPPKVQTPPPSPQRYIPPFSYIK